MKLFFKGLCIACSVYSRIPVPQFDWTETDMKYMLCFFPWIGAVIGAGLYLWRAVCVRFEVGNLCYTLVGAAIPLLITGGFHADGFLDTMDALHSYRSREKKLAILKDAHVGAFAVIQFAVYGMLYLAAFSEITGDRLFRLMCGAFFLSRCLSGISVVSFPSAKREGMLSCFAEASRKKAVKISLYLQGVACIGYMIWQSAAEGILVTGAALFTFWYYYRKTKKEFGGITGDTAGYFVLLCERNMMLAAAVASQWM